jgi:uncharacterized membrane protein HdeD (DUF308 family)
MTHPSSPRSPLAESWGWLAGFGLLALVAGILALVHPFAASLTVVTLAAVGFIAAGILKAVYAARIRDDAAFTWSLILAALFVFLGFGLWFNPLAGMLSLTAMVGVFFLLIGGLKTAFALHLRGFGGWGWVLASGLLSLVLGVVIFANFPVAARTILGLLLGIELVSTGIAFLIVGLILRAL